MTSEELLKKYICVEYKSVRQFALQTGLKYSTIAAILSRGLATASIDNVFEICDALDINVEALIKDVRIEPRTANFNRQINSRSNRIDRYIDGLTLSMHFDTYTLDGRPLTTPEINFIEDGIQIVLNQLRAMRKREQKLEKFKKKLLEDQEEDE